MAINTAASKRVGEEFFVTPDDLIDRGDLTIRVFASTSYGGSLTALPPLRIDCPKARMPMVRPQDQLRWRSDGRTILFGFRSSFA